MKQSMQLLSTKRIIGFFTLLFLILSVNIQAQRDIEIGLTGNCGYTPVNFEKALGYSDDYMEDWDQVYYSASLKGFLTSDKKFHFGVEIAWNRLYYAYYIVPYGTSRLYYEYNINTISFVGLARYSPKSNFFILIGAGIHIFDNGVGLTIPLDGGYSIRLGEKWKIPVSLRWNPIFSDGFPEPVSFGIGASYTIK